MTNKYSLDNLLWALSVLAQVIFLKFLENFLKSAIKKTKLNFLIRVKKNLWFDFCCKFLFYRWIIDYFLAENYYDLSRPTAESVC